MSQLEEKNEQLEQSLRSKMQDSINAKDILKREMQSWQVLEKELSDKLNLEIAAREGAETALQKLSQDMDLMRHQLSEKISEVEEAAAKIHELNQRQVQEAAGEGQTAAQPAVTGRSEDYGLSDVLDAVLWEYDLAGARYTFVSSQVEKILGHPVNSWIEDASFWENHVHGIDRGRVLAFRKQVAEDKKSANCKYRMISSEGKSVWFKESVSVIWEKDHPSKLRGSMSDITATVKMEDDLSRQQNFIDAVLETPRIIIVKTDPRGRLTDFNRFGQQLTGKTLADSTGKFFWEVFSDADEAGTLKTVFERLSAGQFPIHCQSVLYAGTDREIQMLWNCTAVTGRENTIDQFVATGSVKSTGATPQPEKEQEPSQEEQQ